LAARSRPAAAGLDWRTALFHFLSRFWRKGAVASRVPVQTLFDQLEGSPTTSEPGLLGSRAASGLTGELVWRGQTYPLVSGAQELKLPAR
jgi:hypothetical protein